MHNRVAATVAVIAVGAGTNAPARPPTALIRHVILVNLANPKLSVFFLTFLPKFIAADDLTPARQMLRP